MTKPLVVLGVGGGIAAYKACELVRRLGEHDCDVQVIPTQAGLEFVGRAAWEALSGRRVSASVWDDIDRVAHVEHGRSADAVIVAPATADLLARAAAGQADDLLTSTLLATTAPVIFAPAMHSQMWDHPATKTNVSVLRSRGAIVLEPGIGRLTGSDTGIGRMPEPDSLASVVRAMIDRDSQGNDLEGLRVLVTAGGTRERLDPVRFIGNSSSGRQGWALAAAAVARGAKVRVVAANVGLADPAGADLVRVGTAQELRDVVAPTAAEFDVIVMAAAIADYRPVAPSATKLKKTGPGVGVTIDFEETIDVLAELGATRPQAGEPFLVGFAAETVDDDAKLQALAAEKLAEKRCDFVVANRVGPNRGFDVADNEVLIVDVDGSARKVGMVSKEGVANAIWDEVVSRRR